MDDPPFPLAISGLAALVLSAFAWWRDHRRRNRSDPDAVGWVPWTTVYFLASFAAVLALGAAGAQWLRG